MQHFTANFDRPNCKVYAWRAAGSNMISYRCYFGSLGWGPTETETIPPRFRNLTVSELMNLDWDIQTEPVPAS